VEDYTQAKYNRDMDFLILLYKDAKFYLILSRNALRSARIAKKVFIRCKSDNWKNIYIAEAKRSREYNKRYLDIVQNIHLYGMFLPNINR